MLAALTPSVVMHPKAQATRFGEVDLLKLPTDASENTKSIDLVASHESSYINPMVFDKDEHPENVPLLLRFNEQVLKNFETLSAHAIQISEAMVKRSLQLMNKGPKAASPETNTPAVT